MHQLRTPYLFVYGTLRPKHFSRAAISLRRMSSFVCEATVYGTMCHLGWYPAVVLHSRGRPINGDVVKLKNPSASIAFLDCYEGAHAFGHDYKRRMVRVNCRNHCAVMAQIYVAKTSVRQFPVITSGSFPLKSHRGVDRIR
jgi:gamma-glutamylcyclotransferase (GGCT)/AIG2-like uncharacterized protein YtfP